jgi:hypothetical protein
LLPQVTICERTCSRRDQRSNEVLLKRLTLGKGVNPIRNDRTREQAAKDFETLNAWDNSNSNVWMISLAPWLGSATSPAYETRGTR